MLKIQNFKSLINKKYLGFILVSLSVGISIFSLFAYQSYVSYFDEYNKIKIQANNMGIVLEEHLNSSFDIFEQTLSSLQDIFESEFASNQKISKDFFKKVIKKSFEHTRDISAIRLYDKDGYLITDTANSTIPKSVNDRDYFIGPLNSTVDKMFISKPIKSRVTQKWVLIFSKRVVDSKKNFYGVITCVVDLEHIKNIFNQVKVGNNGAISFYDIDKYLYVRSPEISELIGKKFPNLNLDVTNLKNENDISYFESVSPIDGVRRIASKRKLANHEFVIVVGISQDEQMHDWQKRTIGYSIIITISFFLFGIFLIRFLLSQVELEEQRKQSLQSAKLTSLGEMAAGIAHEINNPLTIIQTSVDSVIKTINNSEDLNKEKVLNNLNRISRTVPRIVRIIKGLRNFSRDSFNDPFEVVTIGHLIEECLDLSTERFKSHGVELKINIENPTETLECRQIQLCQVLVNLLNNSFDAIKDLNERWVEIKTSNDQNNIKIVITDSGNGIDDLVVEKIMEPFFTTKEIGKGTGLGLSISKGLIESHNGSLTLDRDNPHTSFIITIPRTHVHSSL